jgi:hypothetical protein
MQIALSTLTLEKQSILLNMSNCNGLLTFVVQPVLTPRMQPMLDTPHVWV